MTEPVVHVALVERIAPADLVPRVCATEAQWYACWQRLDCDRTMPSAIAGGASADRLAWVFMSGYQSVIRARFDGVVVPRARILAQPQRARQFRHAESLNVLAALNAHVLAQSVAVTGRGTAPRHPAAAAAARGLDQALMRAGSTLDDASLDARLRRLAGGTASTVELFSAELLADAPGSVRRSWRDDRRLLRMFAPAESRPPATGPG